MEAEEEEVYAVIQELVEDVEAAMEDDYDFDADEDLLGSLRTCIQVLLDEYEAAYAEDEGDEEEVDE